MEIGIAIFVIFTVALGFVLFRYENPSQRRGKITVRGGDFQE
jgi:hypothetical protein